MLNWSTIDTVLLDMDGTLLDLHFDNYFWKQHLPKIYANTKDQPPEQALKELLPLFERHAGTLNWYCVEFWSDLLDVDIMRHKKEVEHKIGYLPDAEPFLVECRRLVQDLRLVTNGHRHVLNLKQQSTRLHQYFDTMVCSHELEMPKEEPLFWRSLSAEQYFDPERTLLIDDNEAVLKSAEEFGICHLYSIEQPDSKDNRSRSSDYPMLSSLLALV